uniref:Gypsy retrotransposon integrase-like protein 1 n=1 Tax=Oreochromis niloticus TaxID=8128 RepID=A0A669E189_ORENI
MYSGHWTALLTRGGGTLSFPDGGVVRMLRRPPQPDHPAAHALSERAADSSPDLTGSPAAPKDPLTLTSTAPHAASCPPLLPKEPPDKGGRVSAVRRVWEENCDGLTASEQGVLWQLLLDFKDCFSFSEDDMGCTDLIQHDIDTGDAQPIRMRPRRLPLARQAAAERALREMERAGLIEPSTSPWASPVVMVPKKVKDEWRFCVDFWPLNKVTKKDPYPLPRIDETLDTVAGSSWFSSLDLRSGYWQVPLAPDARPKTACITNGGLWQFKVLPFGLCNAPATFERLMDKVLTGIPRGECVVYLDDILVHGASFHAALGALRQVLERVLAVGFKLNPRKCCLMRREVAFLGHRLGAGGVGTMDDKIQAVKDWPTPRSVQELKSFLGLASYYRRFVRGFSCIAAPLFHLLQKSVTFQWTAGCQVPFTSLQEALVGAPVLSPPDPTLPFVLDTDASSVGSGAVLAQVTPGGEKVVAYHSRAFNKAERRYCVTRRELLAVVCAICHFKYYLGGLHFTVRMDHAALQWLMSFKEPEGQLARWIEGKLARWIEELQAYDFEVVHRPGAQHRNADALSRRPCAQDGCHYCERKEAQEEDQLVPDVKCAVTGVEERPSCQRLVAVDATEWSHQQEEDADIKPVLGWIEEQRQPQWEEIAMLSRATKGLWSMFNALRRHDGVLQSGWKEPATGEMRWQLVVPWALQEMVLHAVHGAPGSGHFGVTKTLRRLRQGFYWARHRRDVEDFCRRCDSCTARKGPTAKSHAQLQQFPAGYPMERVGMDILGPFPRTERGNHYILTAMDYFTKWPEAYSLPDQEAETIVDARVEGMFNRFGVPEVIHTDQGRNFESRVRPCARN